MSLKEQQRQVPGKNQSKNQAFEMNKMSPEEQSVDQPVFLRTDLNQLFDNMMISSNFNLKKYEQNKQIQTRRNTKRLSVELKLKNSVDNNLRKRRTEPADEKFDQANVKGGKRVCTQKQQAQTGYQYKQKMKPSLKTDNLNKLLKKRDVFSIANTNKGMSGSKTMTNSFQVTSTNMTNKSSKEQIVSPSTQNENPLVRGKNYMLKNVRKKMMLMTQKQDRTNRIQSEGLYQNKRMSISFKNQNQEQVTSQAKNWLSERKDNYNQLQRNHNKGGPLKFKNIENWLNNIIEEYCHDEYFDGSLTTAALKKYYIDSNSLLSNGVEPSDVSRIYNSLFVYSIGFNSLIKEISKGNRQLVKNIWKVYSLLLEYCAAGNYQTLIGEIERDKLRKVQELKVQIQKRQEIIEKNEEFNEHKNMAMYKQLKRLKDENINLGNEREILMEDFQQADQAFNEQVSLRLKFENTISQIYGVYKQLQNKHGRLYKDFQGKLQQLRRASNNYFQQTKTSQKYKHQLIELKQDFNILSKVNSHDKEHIDVLLEQLSKMKQNYFRTLKQLQYTKYINVEKERKVQQMQIQLDNNKIILDLREKSAKETHAEYRITLQQNNKLFMMISQQRQQMQGLLKQKKQFNQNVLKILADSSYYKKRHESAQVQIKTLNQKASGLQMALQGSQVKNQTLFKDIQSCRNDLQSNYVNIRNMHERNFVLQEELQFLRKYQGNMDKVIKEKEGLIGQLKTKVEELQKKAMEDNHDLMNLESKHKILLAQLKVQKQFNLKKVQDFRKQQEQMSTNQSSLSKLISSAHAELERYKVLFNNTLMDFKNQKFERSNLTLNYEQILKVLEKKNTEQKETSIKINQLQEQVNQYREKYKLTHLNLISTREDLNLKITHLKQKAQAQKQILDHKAHHYHPMLFQDLHHRCQRQAQRHLSANKALQAVKKEAATQKSQYLKLGKRQKLDSEFQLDRLEKKQRQLQQKFMQQLQYQKHQNQKMSKRLAPLQILQATYKQKVALFQHKETTQNNEQKLAQQISQKNYKIKALYQEVQKIHDLKRDQILELEQKVKDSQNEKMNFVYQFKFKKQREMKQQLQIKYQRQIQRIKQSYEQKIKSGRKKILPLIKPAQGQLNQTQVLEDYFRQALKSKTLEDILKIKKQQYQSANQIQNNNFFDQIQKFFKRSANGQNNQFLNRTNEFSSSKETTQKDFSKSPSKGVKDKTPVYLQKLQNTSQDLRKRNQISRKLRNAYQYYGKDVNAPK